MSVYLRDLPRDSAWNRWLRAIHQAGQDTSLPAETLPLDEKLAGRVLADAAWAKISSPHYHAAAMDGFALQASATREALPSQPVDLVIGQTVQYVDTGDPLPPGTDAVIPIEQIESMDENGAPAEDIRRPAVIRLRSAVSPWSSVRLLGEDMVASQLVLPGAHILTAADLGALAASGFTSVEVIRKPRVHILPTGDELIPIGEEIQPGRIIEFNSIVLAGLVNGWGAQAFRHAILKDDYESIRVEVLAAAADADLILLNAGSSAGSEDYSSRVVEENGDLLVHGVAIKPGHPIILGMINDLSHPDRKVPIVGVPGYPVSAVLAAELFIRPLLDLWLAQKPVVPEEIQARLTHRVNSPAGDDEYIRVAAGRVNGEMLASPLPRGAGVISSLTRSDGLILIPKGVQGLDAGDLVQVQVSRDPTELERTLFFSGSHDLTLDVLSEELARSDIRVVCTNVGSLGGLAALRRGEAHAAGSHLLDADSGEYNLRYIREYLSGHEVAVVHWVQRIQGLIVARGTPLGITSLEDLRRKDIHYINRQRGAGTRVLLDFHLSKLGIQPTEVNGYELEEFTHLAVAAAVQSGRADCGLGITAAAAALGCDFIPLYREAYELVIPAESMRLDRMKTLLHKAKQPTFRARIAAMPGYEVDRMGEIRAWVGAPA
jgi:putative molybdopterin biosynthesis protein